MPAIFEHGLDLVQEGGHLLHADIAEAFLLGLVLRRLEEVHPVDQFRAVGRWHAENFAQGEQGQLSREQFDHVDDLALLHHIVEQYVDMSGHALAQFGHEVGAKIRHVLHPQGRVVWPVEIDE